MKRALDDAGSADSDSANKKPKTADSGAEIRALADVARAAVASTALTAAFDAVCKWSHDQRARAKIRELEAKVAELQAKVEAPHGKGEFRVLESTTDI